MNQIFDFEGWMADMVRYVQILDGSSVTGCPLPPRTKPRESVRKRHFHLQGVREVEYTKGTKGRPVQCCSGDKVPTATYRGKHPRVNRAGPDPADTPPPTMRPIFTGETAEIIKPQAFSPTSQEPRVAQGRIQTATSYPSPAVLAGGSPPPSTTGLHRTILFWTKTSAKLQGANANGLERKEYTLEVASGNVTYRRPFYRDTA
jgi:hypothetical protein